MVFASLLVACGQLPASTQDAEPAVIISPNDDRDYDLIELANGLEVILVSDPNAEKSAAALSIGLGAASDPEEYPGMAH
jgi:protease-3